MKGTFISQPILLIIFPFDGDESFCKARESRLRSQMAAAVWEWVDSN